MKLSRRDELKELVRMQAENDLEAFIHLVHTSRLLGDIHRRVIRWWSREGARSHQLLLLPRDHQKSALLAYRCAQAIVRNPAIRIIYISSTSLLATKQLKFIKDILTSDAVRFYWPDLVFPEEARREKWTESEISVDHPKRKAEFIRDPTIFACGLNTNVVGLHCDIMAFDDVVNYDNSSTADGREKVEQQYSHLSSVEGTESLEWVVGTHYDPRDLYVKMKATKIDIYDDEGELESSEPLFEYMQEQVEDRGDGYGQFLWPKQRTPDGRYFGFDSKILARKKAQYASASLFRAQYYNDPNDLTDASIKREYFQYFDRKHLTKQDGRWVYKGRRLNVFAAIDFAFSLAKRADYTALVVVGLDGNQNYYVLDIERFKGEMPSDYFKIILQMYQKWDFRKLRAEVTVAQEAIVKALRFDYIRPYGLALSIDEHRPSRNDGDKAERIEAALQSKYENRQMWHYEGGNAQILEDELVLQKPPHDDIKDALAACVQICVAPASTTMGNQMNVGNTVQFHSRFGGVI